MTPEPTHLSKTLGRQKPWSLFVMIGFGVAAIGFALLPSIILTPIAPVVIAGGFAFSLGAYLAGRFRVSALKAIRKEERQGSFLD
ncbi:MAG TPA: hypothetical protein VGH65_06545 [Verrucomicrobiaceae bacterium]|jgi:hypothetical protein